MVDHPQSKYTNWPVESITLNDLKKYLGIMLDIGLNKGKPASEY